MMSEYLSMSCQLHGNIEADPEVQKFLDEEWEREMLELVNQDAQGTIESDIDTEDSDEDMEEYVKARGAWQSKKTANEKAAARRLYDLERMVEAKEYELKLTPGREVARRRQLEAEISVARIELRAVRKTYAREKAARERREEAFNKLQARRWKGRQ